MNTSAIIAFVTAAEENSFSLAAEKLHLTQPGISKRIQSLEDHLRHRLFDRIGRRIYLTEAGKTFLPHAYELLQSAQNGINAVQNLDQSITGKLAIATTQHIGLHHLATPIKNYAHTYHEVSLTLDFITSKQAYLDIQQGKLELAVITEPFHVDEELTFVPLWPESLVLVCAHEHPLSPMTGPTLAQISQYPAVLPSADSFTRRLIDNAFAAEGLTLNASSPSNFLEALKVISSAGLGWTVLPTSLLDDSLQILDVPELNLMRHIGYLTHKQRTKSNAATAFIKSLLV
ncbi:LysR family transcriptional regulator [Marinomonas agarivorans]|nr:LysR family transcriptional regulator [Marinomonas agarivorans]